MRMRMCGEAFPTNQDMAIYRVPEPITSPLALAGFGRQEDDRDERLGSLQGPDGPHELAAVHALDRD